jgi:cobalamin biosynthesis Mg chelatase CobN
MKQLLIICISLSLFSCNASKKATSATHATADSTGAKSSSVIEVRKKDSTGTNTATSTDKKTTEAGYKKTTTTVKEYFGDEFDFEGDTAAKAGVISWSPSKDSAKIKAPGKRQIRPIARETTTTVEEGNLKAIEEAAMLSNNTGKIQNSDSAFADHKETANKTTTQNSESTSKLSLSLLPWWIWLLIVLAIVGVLYFKIRF